MEFPTCCGGKNFSVECTVTTVEKFNPRHSRVEDEITHVFFTKHGMGKGTARRKLICLTCGKTIEDSDKFNYIQQPY